MGATTKQWLAKTAHQHAQ